jgi:hypothetical protein
MGIGIGWPNATSGATPIIPKTGWFNITIDCNGDTYAAGTWTQELTDTILQSGQYAFSPSRDARVLLGIFSETLPEISFTVTIDGSQGFNSCPT